MADELVINVGARTATAQPLTTERTDDIAAYQATVSAREAAEAAEESDIKSRRAQVLADLQAIRDATSLAAVKMPLLRTLVFLLKRLQEQAE